MTENEKMEMLLRLWEEKNPETFTVESLKSVLASEVSKI